MKSNDLLTAMNDLDEDLILDARSPSQERSFGKRRMVAIFTAAVLTVMLIGCAYTVLSEADWFKNFFTKETEQSLSDGQIAYIDSRTQEISQSVTVDGYTLTVVSAIADSYNAYIKLQLQSPPGVPLDADFYSYNSRRLEDGSLEQWFYREDGKSMAWSGTWEAIDDGDSNDNSFSILYSLHVTENSEYVFEEGITYKLHITDLRAYYEDSNTDLLLVEDGVWDFDIVFETLNDEEAELITEPVASSFHDFHIEVTSLKLHSMSGSATYTGIEDEKGIICFIDSAVVLKDGTRVSLNPNVFGPGYVNFVLSSPILLEEVDYVALRDGAKIYMPEQ